MDWRSTLLSLGIDGHQLTGRHTGCPGCGGKDRFRFDNREGRGTWICGGGGHLQAGDGWDLLNHVFGWDFKEAHERLDMPLKPAPRPRGRSAPKPEPKPPSKHAQRLWAEADRSSQAVASHPYAVSRRITWEAGGGRVHVPMGTVVGGCDCLIWPVRDIKTREICAVHCINEVGAKQTFGSTRERAVMFGHPHWSGRDWYIVEGVADAVSMFRTFGTVVFAALGTGKVMETLAAKVVEVYAPERIVVVEDAS